MDAAAGRPKRLSQNPLARTVQDLRAEWRARGHYPPGPTHPSSHNTWAVVHDPVPMLLDLYERHGPVFTTRLFHGNQIWMLGPEANHYILVSNPGNFVWREGGFADLIPLLGDGLLTIDGAYHDRARRIMMPAFHREQIDASARVMVAETERATADWRDGDIVDVYSWMRDLAMRIAMRALLGLDPDDDGHGVEAARHFELALSFFSTDAHQRVRRDPWSPWHGCTAPAPSSIGSCSPRSSAAGGIRTRRGWMSSHSCFEPRTRTVRSSRTPRCAINPDVLFAGHDTSTTTVTFLLYELARNTEGANASSRARRDRGRRLTRRQPYSGRPTSRGHGRDPAALSALPRGSPARSTRLRVAGARSQRDVRPILLMGEPPAPACVRRPGRLPPERIARSGRPPSPSGAYVPSGGPRICIGKRFGQTEVKLVAAMLLERFALELLPGHQMTVRQAPTLGPEGGLPMRVRAR